MRGSFGVLRDVQRPGTKMGKIEIISEKLGLRVSAEGIVGLVVALALAAVVAHMIIGGS